MTNKTRIKKVVGLGSNPVEKLLPRFILLCLFAAIGILIMAFIGGTVGSVLALLIFLASVLLISNSLTDLWDARGNVGIYRATSRAIRRGFKPDWMAKGLAWNGVVALDDGAQNILVNGYVFPYSSIYSIRQDGTFIAVEAGEVGSPLLSVELDSTLEAENALERIRASLKLPAPTTSNILST